MSVFYFLLLSLYLFTVSFTRSFLRTLGVGFIIETLRDACYGGSVESSAVHPWTPVLDMEMWECASGLRTVRTVRVQAIFCLEGILTILAVTTTSVK